MTTTTDCSHGQCSCAQAAPAPAEIQLRDFDDSPAVARPMPLVRINGIALNTAQDAWPEHELHERAYAELLRQQAIALALLPRTESALAPQLSENDQRVIEDMLDREVITPSPSNDECQRYYEQNAVQFTVGQSVHMRHILFAVTPGVPVQALTQRAQQTLLELSQAQVSPEAFARLAAELSNCPSSTDGGDLGWVSPHDCAPELSNILFSTEGEPVVGVYPQLLHSRFGLHIVDVLERKVGEVPEFSQVHDSIDAQLRLRSRAQALRHYMQRLVGLANIEGLTLQGNAAPLMQ